MWRSAEHYKCYAECRYAGGCSYDLFHYADGPYAECHYYEDNYAQYLYAELHYAAYDYLLVVILSVTILSITTLYIIMLRNVAPHSKGWLLTLPFK